jgi:hypothetical protein
VDRNEIMRRAKWPLIFLLVAAGVAGAILYYYYFIRIEPGPLLESALSQAHQAKSYSYTLDSELDIGGKKQKWIQVQGQQAAESYHFQGETLGTPVEIYQIGMRSYTKDPVSGNWTILDGVDLSTQQLYMAEIDPLSSFQFKNIGEPLLLGKEEVGNIKCALLELEQPKVESKYMEIWWKDFTYRFWIDRRKEQLVKAEITAVSTQSRDTSLTMTVDFKDFNRKIKINPPI